MHKNQHIKEFFYDVTNNYTLWHIITNRIIDFKGYLLTCYFLCSGIKCDVWGSRKSNKEPINNAKTYKILMWMIRKFQEQGLRSLKIKSPAKRDDCFQRTYNAVIGVFLQPQNNLMK